MRLNCPFCGKRGIAEFSYAGDASVTLPGGNAGLADWVEYVYFRDNPAGLHSEYWYHAAACRQVLQVERDTRSHEVTSVRGVKT